MKTRKKIEVLDKAPAVSGKEIEAYMDFDTVLNESSRAVSVGDRYFKITVVALGIILAGISSYYLIVNEESSVMTISTQQLEEVKKDAPITKTVESPKENRLVAIEPKKDEPVTKSTIPIEQKEEIQELVSEEDVEDESTQPPIENETVEEPSYSYVEAVPVEGITYLYAYFQENLTYPNELRKDSIEGVVLVSFSILKDSTVSNIKIVQSLGDKFDNEAIRVVDNMPKWIPAKVNDTPVDSKLSIPLTFNIEK